MAAAMSSNGACNSDDVMEISPLWCATNVTALAFLRGGRHLLAGVGNVLELHDSRRQQRICAATVMRRAALCCWLLMS